MREFKDSISGDRKPELESGAGENGESVSAGSTS
jgi:hypothetical protein